MLPVAQRLRTSADYTAVMRGRGRSKAGGRLLVLHAAGAAQLAATPFTDPSLPPRVGFVVSKAVGNAVVRNRVKRRLRDLVAHRITTLPPGSGLVVRAMPAAARASYADLGSELDLLLTRALKASK